VRDDRSAVGKYLTILIFWLIPVALMLIPILYPTEGYVRDMLLLPVTSILLYVSFLLFPLFCPFRILDLFAELPEAPDRNLDAHRVRSDPHGTLKHDERGRLRNGSE